MTQNESFNCYSVTAISNQSFITFLGRDMIAQAQSGTGKTATFSTAVHERIDTDIPEVQALIMAPTRELALQVGLSLKY